MLPTTIYMTPFSIPASCVALPTLSCFFISIYKNVNPKSSDSNTKSLDMLVLV